MVYVDATSIESVDRRFEAEVVRLVRTAMQPFEPQLERIQVHVSSRPEGHRCRLHARAERGQTVVIESSASSRLAAVESATDSLRRAIAERAARGTAGAAPASAVRSPGVEREGATHRSKVLLALLELDASSACVAWGRLLAASLEAHLDVCRVLPHLPATDGPPSGRAWLDATRRLLSATRETRRWCAEALPDAALSERLIASPADIVDEAAWRAREHDVDWIVMPDLQVDCGRTATALARASGRPVLVARAPTSRSTLLVATDVSEDLSAIASRTASLAEALHAPVLAFHDTGCSTPELDSRVNALTEAWAQLQAERLAAGGPQRLPELEVLLAHGSDRVEIILRQARREDAEIIIVGVSSGAEGADADVAADIVDRAVRSVLVVPAMVPESTTRQRSSMDSSEVRPTNAGTGSEHGHWPKAGSRPRHPNDPRRWRSG